MKKLIFILILIPFMLFTSIAQIDWIGDAMVNKHIFSSDSDSILCSIMIQKSGTTDKSYPDNTINCKAVLRSNSYNLNNEIIQSSYNFSLYFEKQEGNRHLYSGKIPTDLINNGRYTIEFLCSDNNSQLSSNQGQISPITIGDFGIIQGISSISINDNIDEYAFLSFNNSFNLLPEVLEGAYTAGFCSDESISFSDFNFQIWKNNTIDNLEFNGYYSIDGESFIKLDSDKLNIIDSSTDGTLDFGTTDYEYPFYNDEAIEDLSIGLQGEIDNLISQIKPNDTGEHKIRFYFTLQDTKNTIRFPLSGFITSTFFVSDSPSGADCQAFLLPIDLLSLEVLKLEKTVHIKWETASEVNNDFFEIQRSKDYSTWQILDRIEGKGNSNNQNSYRYTDLFPLSGDNYYRLRQTDFDGAFKYSKVKVVSIYDNKLVLSPNPASDYIYYSILNPGEEFKVEIYNSLGQLAKTTTVPDKYSSEYRIDIRHLKTGTYFIRYLNLTNNQVKLSTFIKSN